jgi:hypothetical protein
LVDHVRGTMTQVEAPDDIPMNRLIPDLTSRLGLPTDQEGQPVTYRLDNRDTGERIGDEQTLAEAGVRKGTVLQLGPQRSFWLPFAETRQFPRDLRLTLSEYTPAFLGTAVDNDCCLPDIWSAGIQPHHALIVAVDSSRFAIVCREGPVAINEEPVPLVRFFVPGSDLSLGRVTYRFDVDAVEKTQDGSRTWKICLRLNSR